MVFLPFARLRFKIILPVLVRSLDKNPCRRFRTTWEGLNVSRFAPRTCKDCSVGWERGRRLESGMSSCIAAEDRMRMEGRVVRRESVESDLAGLSVGRVGIP